MSLLILAEALRTIANVILILSSAFYLRHLEKMKKKTKLSTIESTMYITIQIAYLLFAISVVVFVFFE